jgi:hypothetical protein
MRIACWITKATNTHPKYVILIAFPQQQWLHEHSSMLRDTQAACLVSAHSWSALRSTAVFFPRCKSVGAWCWPLTSLYWNCTSTCVICPHGEDRDKFTFSLLSSAKTAGFWNVASLFVNFISGLHIRRPSADESMFATKLWAKWEEQLMAFFWTQHVRYKLQKRCT